MGLSSFIFIKKKKYFGLLMYTKTGKDKILKSYIVLLSYQPTSTGQSAHLGRMAGAGWLVTQKTNGEIFF